MTRKSRTLLGRVAGAVEGIARPRFGSEPDENLRSLSALSGGTAARSGS